MKNPDKRKKKTKNSRLKIGILSMINPNSAPKNIRITRNNMAKPGDALNGFSFVIAVNLI